jgi:hypothetical protein
VHLSFLPPTTTTTTTATQQQGYLYFENGDVFFATWDNGLLLLPCSVLYVNGDKYVGDWSGKAVRELYNLFFGIIIYLLLLLVD